MLRYNRPAGQCRTPIKYTLTSHARKAVAGEGGFLNQLEHGSSRSADSHHADYQMLAESLPQLVFVKDAGGGPLYFNQRWFAYTGISPEIAFTRDGWLEAVHPDDRDRADRLYVSTVGVGSEGYEIEYRLLRSNGESRWFLTRALPQRNAEGSILRWFGTCTDIDDIKRASTIEASLAATEQRYRELADWLPLIITTRDPNGRLIYLNAAWYRYTGQNAADLTNQTWADALHPDDLQRVRRDRGNSIPEGRAIKSEVRVKRADGEYRWFLNQSVPVRSTDGTVTSWIGTMADIDDQKRGEETLRIINEASAVFANVLDVDLALKRLAELVVRHLADTCTVDIVTPDGSLRNAAVAGRSEESERFLRQCVFRKRRSENGLSWRVAQSGEPYRTPLLAPEELLSSLPAAAIETRRVAMALGRRAVMLVPIVVDGRVFGTLGLANSESATSFSEEDERLTILIARRAAIAISQATLFNRQRDVARKLQSSFLPSTLPHTDRLAFEGVYVAAVDDLMIGGDWYDAFLNKAGGYGFSIGDIEGHGLESAVVMGKMRQTLNTLAFADLDPVHALAIADGVLEREHPGTFATAFAARYGHHNGVLEYANAGHPPPFVRERNGVVRQLAPADVPVGLGDLHERAGHLETLHDGETLVAFSDGLIELTRDLVAGERRVAEALAHPAFRTCSEPAKLLRALVLTSPTADDVAILALRIGEAEAWTFDARDPNEGHRARSEFLRQLSVEEVGRENRMQCEVVLGEIIANVARYTPGLVDVGLYCTDGDVIIAALDRGPGFVWNPGRPDDDNERGRGLFLIDALAAHVRMEYIAGFGSYLEVMVQT